MTAEGRIKFPPPAPVSPADPAPEVFAQLRNCPLLVVISTDDQTTALADRTG
jgi:hypothetical protein